MYVIIFLFVNLEFLISDRALPLLLLVPLLTQTVKTASMLAAIATLDVEVIGEVLEETEERSQLIEELRNKITRRTKGSNLNQQELLEAVFREIDTDGSGEINRNEFQKMLIKLEMCYSDKKFRNLYNAIDRNNDGSLSIGELNHILFPKVAQEQEEQEMVEKVQSHLDHELNHLERKQDSHMKKFQRMSTLKSLTLAAQAARNLADLPQSADFSESKVDESPKMPLLMQNIAQRSDESPLLESENAPCQSDSVNHPLKCKLDPLASENPDQIAASSSPQHTRHKFYHKLPPINGPPVDKVSYSANPAPLRTLSTSALLISTRESHPSNTLASLSDPFKSRVRRLSNKVEPLDLVPDIQTLEPNPVVPSTMANQQNNLIDEN